MNLRHEYVRPGIQVDESAAQHSKARGLQIVVPPLLLEDVLLIAVFAQSVDLKDQSCSWPKKIWAVAPAIRDHFYLKLGRGKSADDE